LQIRQVANIVIDASPVKAWAADVASGRVSVESWHQFMRDEIRRNYIQQYLAGRGGIGKMTFKDWGSIGGMITDQYRYLDKFAGEVAANELGPGTIARRAEMYINSSREAYSRAEKRAVEESELRRKEVRWVEDPVAEHCTDCDGLVLLGWQPMDPWPFKSGGKDIYPGSGDTVCLTSCKCHLEYR